ncbi:MAG TPA: NDP-sugar synthase, partial [Candidatus Binataceae bacterium]|nr:NDP-sugar synthase [Candidatus Binataceae bacterium]
HYALLMLRRAGIIEVAINLHHLAGPIKESLGDGSALGLRITYSYEQTLAGTGGPLVILRDYFGGERFVMLNCDTIIGLDLAEVIGFHQERRALATFVLRDGHDRDAYSRIECGPDSRIQRMRLLKGRVRGVFEDYPPKLDDRIAANLTSYMYCGVMVAEAEVLAAVRRPPPFSLMSGLFAPMLTQGAALYGYIHEGFFRTVDDLEGYNELRMEFSASPPPLAYLPGDAKPLV